MTTSQPHRKPGKGQRRDDIRGSTLAPHTHTVAKPLARNAYQGASPPSRRQPTLLQGSSRGEEASKKLLAVGLAHSAKPRRPQGPSSKAGLQLGVARTRSFRRDLSSCRSPLTHIAGLTCQGTGAKVVQVAADRAQPALCPAGTLAAPKAGRLRARTPAAALANTPHAGASIPDTQQPSTDAAA